MDLIVAIIATCVAEVFSIVFQRFIIPKLVKFHKNKLKSFLLWNIVNFLVALAVAIFVLTIIPNLESFSSISTIGEIVYGCLVFLSFFTICIQYFGLLRNYYKLMTRVDSFLDAVDASKKPIDENANDDQA